MQALGIRHAKLRLQQYIICIFSTLGPGIQRFAKPEFLVHLSWVRIDKAQSAACVPGTVFTSVKMSSQQILRKRARSCTCSATKIITTHIHPQIRLRFRHSKPVPFASRPSAQSVSPHSCKDQTKTHREVKWGGDRTGLAAVADPWSGFQDDEVQRHQHLKVYYSKHPVSTLESFKQLSQAKAMANGLSGPGPREIESDSNRVEADRGCSIDRSSGAACFPGPGYGSMFGPDAL